MIEACGDYEPPFHDIGEIVLVVQQNLTDQNSQTNFAMLEVS